MSDFGALFAVLWVLLFSSVLYLGYRVERLERKRHRHRHRVIIIPGEPFGLAPIHTGEALPLPDPPA